MARTPVHVEDWIACARRITVRRLRDDVDRALLLADGDPEAFARGGGLPDLDAEQACTSGAEARLREARLQTGANPRDPERKPLAASSAPRETSRSPQPGGRQRRPPHSEAY